MKADDILAAARMREDTRAAAYTPPDYAEAGKVFRCQKVALTQAKKQGRDAVILACKKARDEWGRAPFNGAWPDDWSLWQWALDDALGWRTTVRLEDL